MARRAVLLGSALAALTASVAGAAETPTQDAYARAQVMVDVGGRRLNLFCMGSGSPTVVFEAGGGRAGWDWFQVQPHIAKRTRACVYDRAGMGFSDPIARPATAANAAKDLHFLLKNGRVPGPYVLVGNAYGATVVQQYALRPRADVAGLVLLDAQQGDEPARTAEMGRACLAGAERGFEPGSALEKQCVSVTGEAFGPALAAAETAMKRKPSYWRAAVSEAENAAPASQPLIRAGTPQAVVDAVLQALDMQK
jgi:pimeloyl-ACP methyl ester carboxylesterase